MFDFLLLREKIGCQPSRLCSKLQYHWVTPQRCSSAQTERPAKAVNRLVFLAQILGIINLFFFYLYVYL